MPAVIVPPRVVLTKIFPLVVTSCVSATFSSDALTAPEALDARSVSCGLTSPLTYPIAGLRCRVHRADPFFRNAEDDRIIVRDGKALEKGRAFSP